MNLPFFFLLLQEVHIFGCFSSQTNKRVWLCTVMSRCCYHPHFGRPILQPNSFHISGSSNIRNWLLFPMFSSRSTFLFVTMILDIHSSNFQGVEPNLRSKTIISLSSSETRSFLWWGQLECWNGWGDQRKVVFLTSEYPLSSSFVKLKQIGLQTFSICLQSLICGVTFCWLEKWRLIVTNWHVCFSWGAKSHMAFNTNSLKILSKSEICEWYSYIHVLKLVRWDGSYPFYSIIFASFTYGTR